MGRLLDDCNSVAATNYSDDSYRTAHDEEDGILIHDSRDPDDGMEREAMLLPSIQDQLASALEALVAEQLGFKKCEHAGKCFCTHHNAEVALRLHNNEKAIKAAEDAEREQLVASVFGDPLKSLFTSFNREFGSKK
jgi:hypothetical protein